jgi:hypothetical protein
MAELPDYILSLVYAGNRQQLDVDADLLGLRLVDDEQVRLARTTCHALALFAC